MKKTTSTTPATPFVLQQEPAVSSGSEAEAPNLPPSATVKINVIKSDPAITSAGREHSSEPTPSQPNTTATEEIPGKVPARHPKTGKQATNDENKDEDELADDNEFFIPIHGFVRFTEQELEVINHPAFQRLGEIYQLGQAYLTFRGATHKRLEHVLGVVHVAQEIINAVADNYKRLKRKGSDNSNSRFCEPFSKAEQAFLRLAALLHDIGHLSCGHTLEDELGILSKHDAPKRLDLILNRPKWNGREFPKLSAIINDNYSVYLKDKCYAFTSSNFNYFQK